MTEAAKLIDAVQKDVAGGLEGVIQLHITVKGKVADSWYFELGKGRVCWCTGTAEKANLTVTMDDGDFMSLATGKIGPVPLFMKGRVTAKGNIMLAQRAEALFRKKGGFQMAKDFAQKAKL